MKIKIHKLEVNATIPTYGTADSAGADLYSCESECIIEPGQTVIVHTGIAVEIPRGYVGLIFARSGLATKCGLAPANKVGVIDSDYRGEIMVALHNHSNNTAIIKEKERIAQIVISPVVQADFEITSSLSKTDRGTGGFGSTGK